MAKTVDHTVLKLDATSAQIDSLCSEARTEDFKVCAEKQSETITSWIV
jgi:deoxyribose-phosphate aldolase